ncbi:MAG: hypothetical protein IIC90_10350 [Chloroflexi bacterium]|nr:hypothetical protein [Chloroflexota bacterium]
MIVCTTLRATEPVPGAIETPAPVEMTQPTSTAEAANAADVPVAKAPVATATATLRPAATPEPEPLISEVLPVTQPPQAVAEPAPVRGGSERAVPAGTSIVWGGCASDGTCYSYNFYWAPTHEVVMQPGEGEYKVQHELCHAHQHWSISGGGALPPSNYDLESWYETSEAQSFTAAVAGLPWPWTHSAVSGLEDFAWTCGYWYLDAAYLLQVSPERYAWAADHLS